MAYSAARSSLVKLDATPSFAFNNLTATPHALAFAHRDAVYALPAAAVNTGKAALEKVTLREPGSAVTQAAWVTLSHGRPLLVVTSREAVAFYPSALKTAVAESPCFHRALGDVEGANADGRKAEVHYFRGIAAVPGADTVLVGTSWGDVLAFGVGRPQAVGGPTPVTLRGVLQGAHTAPITAIAADDKYIVTADDTGVVAQWAAPELSGAAVGSAASWTPALLARHDGPAIDAGGSRAGAGAAGSPCTCVGIAMSAAVIAGYADGHVRVYRAGVSAAAPAGGAGGWGLAQAKAALAAGRFLEVQAAAHARAVTALAVHPQLPTFATVGEDGVTCVWSLPELPAAAMAAAAGDAGKGVGRLLLDLATRVPTCVHTGVAFVAPAGSGGPGGATGAHLAVASYDCAMLRVYLASG